MLHKKMNVPHIWNYFETRHEKWEHHGVGSCINTSLHMKEMEFTSISLIQDAKSVVEWCSLVMGEGSQSH